VNGVAKNLLPCYGSGPLKVANPQSAEVFQQIFLSRAQALKKVSTKL